MRRFFGAFKILNLLLNLLYRFYLYDTYTFSGSQNIYYNFYVLLSKFYLKVCLLFCKYLIRFTIGNQI